MSWTPRFPTLLLVLCLLWGATACDKKQPASDPTERATTATETSAAPTSADTASTPESGAKAEDSAEPQTGVVAAKSDDLPDNPARIVSLAPNITEILFAIGRGDRVVGVTKFCDYPAAVDDIPDVGGFIDPDTEAIFARKPDLVIGMVAGDERITDALTGADIPYAFLRMENFDQTYRGIEAIGALVGAEDAAAKRVQQMRRDVHEIVARAQGTTQRDGQRPPTALFVLGHDPLVVAGEETFGHELITLAGATNAAAGLDNAYPRLDIEKVLTLDPDVIIDSAMIPDQDTGDFWAAYTESLTAAKTDSIHTFSDPSLLRPGPRLVEALEIFVEAIASEPPQDSQ